MNRRATAIAELEARLGHRFASRDRLERALTHASAGDAAGKLEDNERLEFLGDRVLGLVIAEALADTLPAAAVGELSKRLHGLVSGAACAQVARSIGVGAALRLAGGETRRGGRDTPSILANACEALIAALYLEGGLDLARAAILRHWAPLLASPLDPLQSNPKSALQEWAAASGRPPPAYRLTDRAGPEHRPRFTVEVRVEGGPAASAAAANLRAAEKAAALRLLRDLEAGG